MDGFITALTSKGEKRLGKEVKEMNKYNKIVFVNGSAPPLNADNLNHMDEGIERATDGAIALETEIATARGGSNSLGARLDTVDTNLAKKLIKPILSQGTAFQTHIHEKEQIKNLPESSIQCRSTANQKITARVISQAERFTALYLLKPIKPPWQLNTIRQILKVVHQHSHRIQPSPIKSKVQTVHIRRLVTS